MSESSLASMPIDQQMKPPEKRKAGDPITRKTQEEAKQPPWMKSLMKPIAEDPSEQLSDFSV